jgi:hypothetical protein
LWRVRAFLAAVRGRASVADQVQSASAKRVEPWSAASNFPPLSQESIERCVSSLRRSQRLHRDHYSLKKCAIVRRLTLPRLFKIAHFPKSKR